MDNHHSQKQKRNLLNLRPVVFPDIEQSDQPHRRITPFVKRHFYTQRAVTIGVIATVGLSTAMVQAMQYRPLASQDSKNKQTQSSSSRSIITANIDNSSGIIPAPTATGTDGRSSTNTNGKSFVIINGETIPANNGTITRSFSDGNDNQTNVTVTIDGSSSSQENTGGTTSTSSVNINTSSNSSEFTNNTTRGSP
ncbi:MAG: hypothetical protein ACMG55_07495 [Microcoleus sp.]